MGSAARLRAPVAPQRQPEVAGRPGIGSDREREATRWASSAVTLWPWQLLYRKGTAMATVPSAPKTGKPRPKPERRIRVLEQPTADTDGWAAVAITVGKQTDTYLLRAIPTDFGGTLGFEVEKLDGDRAAIE